MSFFLDANVLVYAAAGDDPRSAACARLLAAVAAGEAEGRTSVAALEEVWHLELSRRTPGLDGFTRRAHIALSPLLPVSEAALALALDLPAARLGAVDRLHAATCLLNGIETIVSADQDFDELDAPARVDPLDSERVEALLAGSS